MGASRCLKRLMEPDVSKGLSICSAGLPLVGLVRTHWGGEGLDLRARQKACPSVDPFPVDRVLLGSQGV